MKLKVASALITSVTLGGTLLAIGAVPANAYAPCGSGHACLYFNSGLAGASYEQSGDVKNYLNYYFSANAGGSNGAGYSVKNNTASIDNWNLYQAIRVYVNSKYMGLSQTIIQYDHGDLNSDLKNNNASGKFI